MKPMYSYNPKTEICTIKYLDTEIRFYIDVELQRTPELIPQFLSDMAARMESDYAS